MRKWQKRWGSTSSTNEDTRVFVCSGFMHCDKGWHQCKHRHPHQVIYGWDGTGYRSLCQDPCNQSGFKTKCVEIEK